MRNFKGHGLQGRPKNPVYYNMRVCVRNLGGGGDWSGFGRVLRWSAARLRCRLHETVSHFLFTSQSLSLYIYSSSRLDGGRKTINSPSRQIVFTSDISLKLYEEGNNKTPPSPHNT